MIEIIFFYLIVNLKFFIRLGRIKSTNKFGKNRNLRSGILRKKFGNVRNEFGGETFGKKSEPVGNTSFMGHSERIRNQSSHRVRKQSESEFFPNSFLTFPNVFRKLSISFRRGLSETFPFFPLGK